MALVRCSQHGHPVGRTQDYVKAVEPLGYPAQCGVICGIPGCHQSGLIWLNTEEARAYESGVRVFSFNTNVTKVMAK